MLDGVQGGKVPGVPIGRCLEKDELGLVTSVFNGWSAMKERSIEAELVKGRRGTCQAYEM